MKKGSIYTLEDLKKSACAPLNRHLFEGPKSAAAKPKKSKYGNTKVEVEGVVFDSIKEANRYKELRLLLKAGLIGLLETQVPFELNEGGTHSLRYIADFVYLDAKTGQRIVEDVKGYRTREYIRKRKLMLKIHNIKIREL